MHPDVPRALRRSACAIAVALAAGAVSVPAGAAGRATQAVYTIKTVKVQGSVWIAGGGKAMRPGRLSSGNRLFETDAIRRDDGVKGTFVATVMVASPGTVPAARAVGLMRGVYRFGDGDIFVDGFVSFGGPAGSGVIVGGTGAYTGARGTFTSTEAKDVLRLAS
jgi:hypothetical protein